MVIEEAPSYGSRPRTSRSRTSRSPTIWNYEEDYSGRFNLRLPPALHEALAEGARESGVSLNQYVVALLARGDAQARIEERMSRLEAMMLSTRPAGFAVADEKAPYDAGRPPKPVRTKTTVKKAAGRRRTA